MHERTRVVPLDDAFPRGEEVSEDELSSLTNTSIRRTTSARSFHGAQLVPIADVVGGDDGDARFLEPQGVICALYAKGKAVHDDSGFVVG